MRVRTPRTAHTAAAIRLFGLLLVMSLGGAAQDSTPWAQEETSQNLPVGLHKRPIEIRTDKTRYFANRLIAEPILYTIRNNARQFIYYMAYPVPVGYCRMTAMDCDVIDPIFQGLYPETSLAPYGPLRNSFTGVWVPPHDFAANTSEFYRLSFRYRLTHNSVNPGPPTPEERIEALSQKIEVVQLPTTKQVTLDLCRTWRLLGGTYRPIQGKFTDEERAWIASMSPCPDIIYMEFGDWDHPIGVAKLIERAEGLLGEPIAVRARVKLDGYATLQKLVDEPGVPETIPILLREDGAFVNCSPQAKFRWCNGWRPNQAYLLKGYLKQGQVEPLEGGEPVYYLEVQAKEELP